MVPEGYTNTGRSWKQGQVGTGPFRLESFSPGQQSVHSRFANYWDAPKPYLDQVTIVDVDDANARMNGLISGQLDAIADVPYSSAKLIQTHSNLVLFNNEGGGWLVLCMRIDQKPFTDVRVRQAFKLIADRPQLLEQALAGYGRIANDMYAPFDPAYLSSMPQRTQDLEQAKSLLKAAGQSDLRINLPTSEVATGLNEMCQVFAQQAKGAGVSVNVQVLDATTFNNGFQKWTFSPDFWGTRLYLPQVAQSELKSAPYNETYWPPQGSNFAKLYQQALAEPAGPQAHRDPARNDAGGVQHQRLHDPVLRQSRRRVFEQGRRFREEPRDPQPRLLRPSFRRRLLRLTPDRR